MSNTDIDSLTGFQDFYPPQWAQRRYLIETWRRVSQQWGMEEYEGPTLEPTRLYTRKSGPEITEQLFAWETPEGEGQALRPEITPTLARMVGKQRRGLKKPVRWFSIPQLFRRETPQRGRMRQFLQWNVDILGTSSLSADLEVATLALEALRQLGLTAKDVVMRISDRQLMEALLAEVGLGEASSQEVLSILDKLERNDPADIQLQLQSAGLEDDAAGRLMKLCQSQDLDQLLLQTDNEAVAQRGERLKTFQAQMQERGYGEFLEIDLGVVRGLTYYTGIVFEIFDRQFDLRALCGGGRYDQLLATVADESMPATGFGMGDAVLLEALQERNLLETTGRELDFYLVNITEQEQQIVAQLASQLRRRGQRVALDLMDRPVGKQFSEADQMGARRVLVIGPDEREQNQVTARDMETGRETRLDIQRLLRQTRDNDPEGIQQFGQDPRSRIWEVDRQLQPECLRVEARRGPVRSSKFEETQLWLLGETAETGETREFAWGILQAKRERWLLEAPALDEEGEKMMVECEKMQRLREGIPLAKQTLLTLRTGERGPESDTRIENRAKAELVSPEGRVKEKNDQASMDGQLFWWDQNCLIYLGKDPTEITGKTGQYDLSLTTRQQLRQRPPDRIVLIS